MFVCLSPLSSPDEVKITGHLHSASMSHPNPLQQEPHLFSETDLGRRHLGEMQRSFLAPETSFTSCLTNIFGLSHFHVVFEGFGDGLRIREAILFFLKKKEI